MGGGGGGGEEEEICTSLCGESSQLELNICSEPTHLLTHDINYHGL